MHKIALGGVIGHPISHSLSPAIFDWISERLKTPLFYRGLDVSPNDLKFAVSAMKALGFVGFNVTIPYKEQVIACLDEITDEARMVGAVNVVHSKGNKLIGHNTDVIGILETLRECKIRVRGRSVVVFGAGGAARSVAYALGKEGARTVYVHNRTRARAISLCRTFSKRFKKTQFEVVTQVTQAVGPIALYINATPLGMKGFKKKSPLPKIVSSGAWAFDLVYRPERTPFLKDASTRGLKTVGGLDMLIWQALATWEIWFGRISSKSAQKTHLKRHLKRLL